MLTLDSLQDSSVLIALFVISSTTLLFFYLAAGGRGKKKALDPDVYVSLPLVEKEELSHDTRRFRFALQSSSHILGLPIGQHVSMRFHDKDGKVVSRSYTPTSSDRDVGHVDFVIKVYKPNVHPKFPEGGKMSFYLENMKIGDAMDMRGPKGSLEYKGRGHFAIRRKDDVKVKNIGMIAGGTGITPMLQIIKAVIREGSGVNMRLIFANQTEEDILLRDMIEDLQTNNPNFKCWYTVDRPPESWKYSSGFITQEMIADHLPPPGNDTIVLMCGPPPMIKFACVPNLEKLGFTEDMHFCF